jgi:hypothetical protein
VIEGTKRRPKRLKVGGEAIKEAKKGNSKDKRRNGRLKGRLRDQRIIKRSNRSRKSTRPPCFFRQIYEKRDK